MSNPFINVNSNTETTTKVNNISANAFGNIVVPIESLSDVNIISPTNGQQMTYNSTTAKWTNTTPASMITALSALTDCSITDPVTNNFLQYNGSEWVSQSVTIDTSLASLSDTSVTSSSNNQGLIYNSIDSKWENKQIDHTTLSNIGSHTHGQIDTFINSKNSTNGICPLDSNNKVPVINLPEIAESTITNLTTDLSACEKNST